MELTVTTHCVDFLKFCACEQFVTPVPIKKQTSKKIKSLVYSLYYAKAPKYVTSGGAHLCTCTTQFRILKKRCSGGNPSTPIAMSLTLELPQQSF